MPVIKPEFDPAIISSSDLVLRIMGDVMSPDIVQFGAAIPDPALIPTAKLNRMLSSEVRRFPQESTAYAMPPGKIFSTTDRFNHCIRLNAAFWSEKTRWAVKTLGQLVCRRSGNR